jgi:acetyltransferase-like isoleucine patch superfamily enzyme
MIKYIYARVFRKMTGVAIKESYVHPTSKVEAGSSFIKSAIDRYSFVGYNCDIFHTSIGPFCSIANNVAIGGGEHPMEWVSMSPVFYSGRDSISKKFSEYSRSPHLETKIGADVWVGHGAKIRQGVSIGVGAVIGMGSVVTKDVPPYSIVVGSPAKVVRFRFDNGTKDRLLSSEWWLLGDETIGRAACFAKDPEAFLNFLEQNK